MPTTDLPPAALEVLRVIGDLRERRQVPTVQAAAIGARETYMATYDLINQLWSAGLLTSDLQLTDAGRKAIS